MTDREEADRLAAEARRLSSADRLDEALLLLSVLADAYLDAGDEAMALGCRAMAALRAVTWPWGNLWSMGKSQLQKDDRGEVPAEVFDRLRPTVGVVYARYADYHTWDEAVADIGRAWREVNDDDGDRR